MIGYLIAPIHPIMRLLFFAGGLMMVDPASITDFIGAAILIVCMILQHYKKRKINRQALNI